MKKRIPGISLILIFCLILSSCGGESANQGESNENDLNSVDARAYQAYIIELENKVQQLEEENTSLKTQIQALKDKEVSEAPTPDVEEVTETVEDSTKTSMFSIDEESQNQYQNGNDADRQYYKVDTENGFFSFSIPIDAEVSVDEKRMEWTFSDEVITLRMTYEIDDTISNAPDCERKIRAITQALPSSIDTGNGENGSYVLD